MIKEWQKQILSIPSSELINEQFFEMMKIFNNAFPCSIVQLFQYSSLNGSISGILSYEKPNVQSIAHIHQSMIINSYVHEALLNNEVRFFYDSKFQLSIGNQIILSEQINNMLLIPFSNNGVVIGYMTGVNVQFEINDDVLKELRLFSDSIVHILHLTKYAEKKEFTDKEIQIMQYISNGYTTKEIGDILHIAESTVKYFSKNVMLKTNSNNRAEAVAKLFRMKILH